MVLLTAIVVTISLGLIPASLEVPDPDENEIEARHETKQVAPVERGTSAALDGISPSIRAVLSRIKSRGITRGNVDSAHVERFSNHLVRVHPSGLIEVYVHVSSCAERDITALYEHEVEIEVANCELGIVQALIPFDEVVEVARLSFVQAITPPSYEHR